MQYIIPADRVIREQGTGKLSIIGTFQFWNAAQFPFLAPLFFVTVGLANLKRAKEINITVRIEDPKTGHCITSAGGKLAKNPQAGDIRDGEDTLEAPIPIEGCIFQEPGEYEVVALVDNERVGSRRIFVKGTT